MPSRWSCPSCGCTSSHYNSTRMAMVCDQCGRAVSDPQREAQRQQYDRTVKHATEHLRVGNWDESRAAILPLCSLYPSNAKLYLILLAALTHGYTDFLLNDPFRCREAAEYWSKLENLHSVNQTMRNYAVRRKQEQLSQLIKTRNIAVAVLIALSLSLMISAAAGVAWLSVCVLLTGGIILWHLLSQTRLIQVAKAIRSINTSTCTNPFIV